MADFDLIKKSYNENGYYLAKGLFKSSKSDKYLLFLVRASLQAIFIKQFLHKGIVDTDVLDDDAFMEALIKLYYTDFECFVNCGKTAQHLMSLHELGLNVKIKNVLSELGLVFPVISTRPVLYFNHVSISKHEYIYKSPPHQDWRSIQGSLNSVVVWIPLVDVTQESKLGPLEIIPGSHLWGLQDTVEDAWFRHIPDMRDEDFVPVDMNVGDVLFFSTFLIHRSGENTSPYPRYSCHFRYNDINEQTFIDRKYPNPYIYKPQQDLITKDFPSSEDICKEFY